MKRENDDNYQDQQQQQMQQQDCNEDAPEQGTDNDDSQDDTNDTNNFNNQNNQNQDNSSGPNPPKRQRRNDDEEVRLLIPSKVHDFNFRIHHLIQSKSFFNLNLSFSCRPLIVIKHKITYNHILFKDGWCGNWKRWTQHSEIAHWGMYR